MITVDKQTIDGNPPSSLSIVSSSSTRPTISFTLDFSILCEKDVGDFGSGDDAYDDGE